MFYSQKTWGDITPLEVEQLIKTKKDVQLIDVREVYEFNEGHVPGSKLIPLGQLDIRHIDIDRNKEAIIICRSGARSATACQYLSSIGFKNVKNMIGGMLNWQGEVER